jgi:predicted RNA-binding protein (virulence factor B family)
VATTEQPFVNVDEFAYLEVAGVNPRIGVFLYWGLEKDLLLPIREMDGPLNPGDRVVVQVVLDDRTDRLIASARFNRRLDQKPPHFHEGESVRMIVASKSPLGYNMVVNNSHRGLIYNTDLTGPLKIGQWVQGYVRAIRPDGKLDLAIGVAGHRRIGPMSEQVMKILAEKGGFLPYHDNSLPEEIREVFGMSKKAFKQAIGALFKEQRIYIEPDGIRIVEQKKAD